CFLFHRCHHDIVDATWNDVVKGRKIATDVQRKTMHGDPITNTYADRCNFAIADPDSDERFASRGAYAVFGEMVNQQCLKPPQISVQILAVPAEIDNRIPHQLAGPMICRLPPTIDGEKRMGQVRATQQTGLIGSAADCVNRLMLE